MEPWPQTMLMVGQRSPDDPGPSSGVAKESGTTENDLGETPSSDRMTEDAAPSALKDVRQVLPTATGTATWLTITEVARRIDSRESTVRSWRDRYPDFVPSRETVDGRTYPLERLMEIQQLQAITPRLSVREIRAELARRYPVEAGDRARAALEVPNAETSEASVAAEAGRDLEIAVTRQVDQIAEQVSEQVNTHVDMIIKHLDSQMIEVVQVKHALGVQSESLAEISDNTSEERYAQVVHRLREAWIEVLDGQLSQQREVLRREFREDVQTLLDEHAQRAQQQLLPPRTPAPRYSLRWWWFHIVGF